MQTRQRLHEKETLAARAEALASAARLEALRARLNPHFLFNALHTLAAVVKFRPALAESAIERLGDMLRYTLKEDSRGLVEFSEEYDFTRQYLAFEQLRYEERLAVSLDVDAGSFDFDVPPFSIQTLAENAVHHAIAIRPEGGSIWITSRCDDGATARQRPRRWPRDRRRAGRLASDRPAVGSRASRCCIRSRRRAQDRAAAERLSGQLHRPITERRCAGRRQRSEMNETILVADDEPLARRTLCTQLRDLGCRGDDSRGRRRPDRDRGREPRAA